MRGENDGNHSNVTIEHGTSPRARGKPMMFSSLELQVRNIPACAGKTAPPATSESPTTEHPRVRGENFETRFSEDILSGTSPRARGKLPTRRPIGIYKRNIPACAGKTVWVVFPIEAVSEHPRVRGENHSIHHPGRPSGGTSPRARGKLWCLIS